MKSSLLILGLILGLYFPAHAQKDKLKNSKWIYDNGDCQEYLEFGRDNKFKHFSCETKNTIYGKYIHKGNEVILDQLRSDYDHAFRNNPNNRTPRVKYKLKIDQDKMRYLVRWDLDRNNKWVISRYDPGKDFELAK